MIEGGSDGRGFALSPELQSGSVSYVDRDWLSAGESPVPSLSFTVAGGVYWCGRQIGVAGEGADPTAVAAGVLLGVAREASAAIPEAPRGGIEVVGSGLIAAQVRRLVGSLRSQSDEGPGVVVETTGDPRAIRSALERVSDLGAVILAGEPVGRRLDLDLYSTVHRRGLVLVGIAPPSLLFERVTEAGVGERDLRWCREALADLSLDSPVPPDSLWFRIVA